MKRNILLSLLLLLSIVANAQLKVDAAGRVGIQTTITNLQSKLTVGNFNPSN